MEYGSQHALSRKKNFPQWLGTVRRGNAIFLWIRTGVSADPDPAFYHNADPDSDSQSNAVPCGSGSWSEFAVTKSWFFLFIWKIGHKAYHTLVGKLFWKTGNQDYLYILVKFLAPGSGSAFPIRYGSRSGEPNQCGSGSTTLDCTHYITVFFTVVRSSLEGKETA
jgi:hypothetical protein